MNKTYKIEADPKLRDLALKCGASIVEDAMTSHDPGPCVITHIVAWFDDAGEAALFILLADRECELVGKPKDNQ